MFVCRVDGERIGDGVNGRCLCVWCACCGVDGGMRGGGVDGRCLCVCGVHVVVWMVEREVVELVGSVIVVGVHVDVQVSPAPIERIVMP